MANRSVGIATFLVSAALVSGCTNSTEPPRARAATLEVVSGADLAAIVGSSIIPTPTVRVADQHGSPMEGVAVAFGFHGGPPTQPVRVLTSLDGTATVAWTLGTRAGLFSVSATVPGLPPVLFTARALPGPATSIVDVGSPQWGAVGRVLPNPVSVAVADAHGNAIPGTVVTFTVISGGGAIETGPVVTDALGVATSGRWTLGQTIGEQRVMARSGDAEVVIAARAHEGFTDLAGDILFVRGGSIYRIGADGDRLAKLTSSDTDQQPAWSPDGSRIAFVRNDLDDAGAVHVMNADGTAIATLADGYAPAWSPDGHRIAYSAWSCEGQGCILVVAAEADGATPVRLGNPRGYHGAPAWSPDGSRIAFVSDWVAFDFAFDIYITTADGSLVTQLTNGFDTWPYRYLNYYLHPAWSPDGARIAFVRGSIINQSDMRFTIAVMNADGTDMRDLARAGDIPWMALLDPGSISWSPDGSRIAFSAVECDLTRPSACPNTRSIKYVTVDGNEQGVIVGDASSPSWGRAPGLAPRQALDTQ